MKYIFLTEQFYDDYRHCTEIERKSTRPYVRLVVSMDGIDFAIPLRSQINHGHVLWTDKKNRCGLDFSKTIVIEDICYVDMTRKPYIRPHEHKSLIGREYDIEIGLRSYIEKYKEAKQFPERSKNISLLAYSTMQYFEKHILI